MKPAIAGALALFAGAAIAWVDTRPTWDDTGVTAGALVIVAAAATLAGLRWWMAAALAVLPLVLAEIRGGGAVLVLAPAVAVAGSLGGVLLRRKTA